MAHRSPAQLSIALDGDINGDAPSGDGDDVDEANSGDSRAPNLDELARRVFQSFEHRERR